MKFIPTASRFPDNKICLTFAGLADLLNASERFVHEKARSGGLRVRLLRPGLPRIAAFDFETWIERQKRRTLWIDSRLQPKDSMIGDVASSAPVETGALQAMVYLTLSDVAEALSVAYESVRTMIRDDGLPVIMMATRAPRVDPTELVAWVRTRPVRAAHCPNPAKRGHRGGPRLRQAAFVDLLGYDWSEAVECQAAIPALLQKP